MDIFYETQLVAIAIAENRLVSALKKMADGAVFSVEVHGITLVDTLHDFGERGFGSFNKDVQMIAHQNVGEEDKSVSLFVGRQDSQALRKVGVILEYVLLLIAAGYDMVKGIAEFYS
jgi:hypothetical protein